MIEQCDLSERRACGLVGLSRDSYRNPPEVDAMTENLISKIVGIAHARRRFGYRANSQKILKAANSALALGHAWAIDGP